MVNNSKNNKSQVYKFPKITVNLYYGSIGVYNFDGKLMR